jgi:hypothetical protein
MLPKKSLTRVSENGERQEIETTMNKEALLFPYTLKE